MRLKKKYRGVAEKEPGFKSTDEILAGEEEAANTTEGVLGGVVAAAEGTLDTIPGAKAAQMKLLELAGVPAEFTGAKFKQLEKEHEIASLGGKIGGTLALGGAMSAGKTVLGKMGVNALQAAMLQPAYKLGALAEEAQLAHDRVTTEQIGAAFSGTEMLEAAGFAGLAGGIPAVGGAIGKIAGKVSKKAAKGAGAAAGAVAGGTFFGAPGAAAGALAGSEAVEQVLPYAKKFADRLLAPRSKLVEMEIPKQFRAPKGSGAPAAPKYQVMYDSAFKTTIDTLFNSSGIAGAEAIAEAADYDKTAEALKAQLNDGPGTFQKIRMHFNSLDPTTADAVAANTMNKLQAAALDLPPDQGPATAFGFATGHSDRQKREFMRKFKAKFDPFYAVQSGRADLVREAEKYNPETINLLRNQAVERLSEDTDLPYLTKRRISAILGVAGTPTQDPALALHLQQQIQQKRKANSQVGQMASARQMKANMKNDSSTLTRAQKILNDTGS